MRSSPVSVGLVSLALLLLLGGCGGPSPETRARQTKTAELGTRTPIPPAPPDAVMLTAEALLPVAPPPIVVGTVAAPAGLAMTEQELTEELIAAAVAKVDAHVCTGQDGCYTFSEALQEARDTCTPKGQCRVGWVVEVGGPESWSVWVEVGTGRVTLISGANA